MNPDPKNDERLPIKFKTAIVKESVVKAMVASVYYHPPNNQNDRILPSLKPLRPLKTQGPARGLRDRIKPPYLLILSFISSAAEAILCGPEKIGYRIRGNVGVSKCVVQMSACVT